MFILFRRIVLLALITTCVAIFIFISLINSDIRQSPSDVFINHHTLKSLLSPSSSAVQSNPSQNRVHIWSPPKAYNPKYDHHLIYRYEYEPFVDRFSLEIKSCPSSVNKTNMDLIPRPMVVLVTSSPANFDRRQAIRETWSRHSMAINVSVFFTMGTIDDQLIMKRVKDEDSINHDLIQWNFVDSYANLTLKSMLALRWSVDHCDQSAFVMKTDDDMYVNLRMFVETFARPLMESPDDNLSSIYGFTTWTTQVNRDHGHSQSVPIELYGGRVYPMFVSGVLYIVGSRAVGDLVSAAEHLLPGLFLEDVYLTGFAADHANIKRQFLSANIAYWSCPRVQTSSVLINRAVIGHKCSPDDLRRIHRLVSKSRFKFFTKPASNLL